MKSKKYWIYTYEIREDFFIAVFEDLLSNEQFFFRINIYYNDLKLLKEFYDDNIKYAHWHLGFDNIAKESQITEYIIYALKDLRNAVAHNNIILIQADSNYRVLKNKILL